MQFPILYAFVFLIVKYIHQKKDDKKIIKKKLKKTQMMKKKKKIEIYLLHC